MIEVIFLITLAIVYTIFAVVQDFRSREVANWLNFSLIIFALAIRFFYCFFEADNFSFFYQGLIGLAIFFVIGNVFYYGRVFAGGDAKLMISYGAILPIFNNFSSNLKFFILFLFLFLFVGAFYGLFVSVILGVKNCKKFKKDFSRRLKSKKGFIISFCVAGLVFLVLGAFQNLLLFLSAVLFIMPFIYIFAKSIDESSMIKKVKTTQLREGDWLYKNVLIGKKKIKSSWDGLSNENIKFLKSKAKFVYIREGIPFTPVFLISFLVLILIWLLDFVNSFWFLWMF